jgi:hypothetical protein
MADSAVHETENIENQPVDANHGDVTETVKKAEVTEHVHEAGDSENAGEENHEDKNDDEAATRKRKSEAGTVPDDDEEESKKAKTDDEVAPTNGSEVETSDQPEVTTKTVEDVQRLAEGDEEVAA